MTELDEHRLEDAIAFLVHRAPKPLTRTALIKLLYFADLRSYELRHRPITVLHWVWHLYGPFASAVYDVANLMNANDELKVDVRMTPYGNPEYRLSEGPALGFYQVLDEEEQSILDSVLKEFGDFGPIKLRDLSYQTEPMQRVGARGDALDFTPYRGTSSPARYVPDTSAHPSSRIVGPY